MKLNAKVLDTHSASQYTDTTRRVTLRVEEADCMNTRLTVKSDELREGTELIVLVMDKDDARGLFVDLENLFKSAEREAPLAMYAIRLRDQLRPDEPPPFMVVHHENGDPRDNSIENLTVQPPLDTADTQEFEREVVR